MQLKEFISDFIEKYGWKKVFWIVGTPNIDLVEFIYKKWFFVQNTHEVNSIYSAMGGFLATKKIHFVIVTSWVWITHTITALTEAYLSNIPLFLISTNSHTQFYGLWNHHDSSTLDDWIDTVWITKSCTCFSILWSHPDSIGNLFFKAYNYALEKHKPVHISISKNLLNEEIKIDGYYNLINDFISYKIQNKKLPNIIYNLLNTTKFPLIITSHQVEEKIFSNFIKKTKIVFLNTLWNVSLLNESEYFLWNYEYVKNNTYNKMLDKFDLIIFLWNTLNKYLIDDDFSSLNKKYILHISHESMDQSYIFWKNYFFIKSDMNEVLLDLTDNIKKTYYNLESIKKYKDIINISYKNKYKNDIFSNFVWKFNLLAPKNSSIFIDVGSVLNYSALFLSPVNKVFVNFPSSFFNMGTAYKAVWYSFYNIQHNFIFIWDGSFYMNMWEIITAIENNLNLTFVILNNNWHWWPLFMKYLNELPVSKFCQYSKWLDFSIFSQSIGVDYFFIDKSDQIEDVLWSIFKKTGVKILEIKSLFTNNMPV